MNRHLFALLCLVLIGTIPSQAQQVLSGGGGSFQNGGTTMTFTVGETVIATFTDPYATLTQGFNQAQLAPELQVEAELGILISGAELLFPTIEPGGSSTLQLTIRNAGNGPFSITALAFTGDPVFSMVESIDPLPSLAAGEALMLTLSFNPDEMDDYTGQLRIGHTDSEATNPFIINLRGSAVIADLPLMPWWATMMLWLALIGIAIRSIRIL